MRKRRLMNTFNHVSPLEMIVVRINHNTRPDLDRILFAGKMHSPHRLDFGVSMHVIKILTSMVISNDELHVLEPVCHLEPLHVKKASLYHVMMLLFHVEHLLNHFMSH